MYILIILSCYLIGSLPFSVWICAAARLKDPRSYGSQNPGSTNVFRQSKSMSVIVLLCDALKGWIPMMMIVHYYHGAFWLLPACAAALVIGHCYSVFLSGNGGKGVATALGCMLAAASNIALYVIALWALILVLSGFRVWLASLLTATIGIFCCMIAIFYDIANLSPQVPVLLALMFMILWRHKSDISRL